MEHYGMYNSDAMGIYTPQSQLDFDNVRLIQLGFTKEQIETLQYIIVNGGKVSTNYLVNFGLSYEEAKKLRYMYEICLGKVVIDNTDSLSKHMRKMFGNIKRIGIGDLAVSKISRVPRKAVVAGITDTTFDLYNSNKYSINERMYDVIDVTSKRIVVETKRKPILKFKQSKEIDGVLEILEVKQDGNVIVAFDKKYCRLCNRFIVVASLRRPEFHHGCIEIIAIEGTKIYVFAKTLGIRDNVKYNIGTERIYEYGFFPAEIPIKIKVAGANLYKQLCGVYASIHPSNQDFLLLTIEENEDEDDNIVIED